jgi:casein kinase 1, epsilon
MNFLHNDLKLENIVIGDTDPETTYLIDFGLATRYLNPETQKHIPKEKLYKFSGNFLFASLSQCRA